MPAWDTLPEGITLGQEETILRTARFGKRKLMFWITNRRLIIGKQGKKRTTVALTLPLDHVAVVAVGRKKGFLHHDVRLIVDSTGGRALLEELHGNEAAAASEFCGFVSNVLSGPR